MEHQIPLNPSGIAYDAEHDAEQEHGTHEVATDLAYKRLLAVNVVYYGQPEAPDRKWVLIDAGLPRTANVISGAAIDRFGYGSRPAAIILTHAHFDHAGGVLDLIEKWDVPVYAHELEHPYLNGEAAYSPPDPNVGNGFLPRLAPFYPRGPIKIGEHLNPLPADGSVPEMPGWKWIHTPGHTPGHISLWRESDKVIIAGDAFITTNQESLLAVLAQNPALHGPPMYFTTDWVSARNSVEQLAWYEPEIVIAGHGPAMRGAEMRTALHTLADNFDAMAVPKKGIYVGYPANAENGKAYVKRR